MRDKQRLKFSTTVFQFQKTGGFMQHRQGKKHKELFLFQEKQCTMHSFSDERTNVKGCLCELSKLKGHLKKVY